MEKRIIGLKELRNNTNKYISKVKAGESFVIMRRSEIIFKISPVGSTDGLWEEAVDFTKIKKGGVNIKDILARL